MPCLCIIIMDNTHHAAREHRHQPCWPIPTNASFVLWIVLLGTFVHNMDNITRALLKLRPSLRNLGQALNPLNVLPFPVTHPGDQRDNPICATSYLHWMQSCNPSSTSPVCTVSVKMQHLYAISASCQQLSILSNFGWLHLESPPVSYTQWEMHLKHLLVWNYICISPVFTITLWINPLRSLHCV